MCVLGHRLVCARVPQRGIDVVARGILVQDVGFDDLHVEGAQNRKVIVQLCQLKARPFITASLFFPDFVSIVNALRPPPKKKACIFNLQLCGHHLSAPAVPGPLGVRSLAVENSLPLRPWHTSGILRQYYNIIND